MDRDREFCKKHCKGYQELGRCIVDGVCENYSKHHPEEQDYSSSSSSRVIR